MICKLELGKLILLHKKVLLFYLFTQVQSLNGPGYFIRILVWTLGVPLKKQVDDLLLLIFKKIFLEPFILKLGTSSNEQ